MTSAGATSPLLIVEDEPPLRERLARDLGTAGFRVVQACDAGKAPALVEEQRPMLVLLEWMLPRLSAFRLCQELRSRPGTARLPVIMFAGRHAPPDWSPGFYVDADDFIAKPFSPAELVARIRAVLHRVNPALAEQLLSFHDLRMDLAAHRVFRGEREVHLSPTEFRLLRHFLEHPGRVFSRAQLLDRVWGSDLGIGTGRAVDAAISRLRRALSGGGAPDLLRTVLAHGYALDHRFAGTPAATPVPWDDAGPAEAARPTETVGLTRSRGASPSYGASVPGAIVSDELWAAVEPLLPPQRPRTTGPAPISDRVALNGILFVLRTRIAWKMLPRGMGCSGATCQERLREWRKAGIWIKMYPILVARLGPLGGNHG